MGTKRGGKVIRHCAECSTPFEVWRSSPKQYCGRACQGKMLARFHASQRRTFNCRICGKEAIAKPAGSGLAQC